MTGLLTKTSSIERLGPLVYLTKTTLMGNSSSSQASNNYPWFSHGLETPDFETESKQDEGVIYEVRKYPVTKWVSTEIQSMSFQEATRQGFRKLFKYISGENSSGSKIPMTCPVAVKIQPSQGPACESTFLTHFYVPMQYQNNTPTPTGEDVALVEYPAFKAFVLSYSGFNSDEKLLESATKLATQLEKDGVDHVKEYYYYAGYDSPYRLFNRHNEVWFVATTNSSQSE